MRCGGVQPFVVDAEMAVVADPDVLATESHQAFDVELILRERIDAFGLKDDDFAAFGFAEVVSEPIDKQMVAGDDLELDQVVAFLKFAPERAVTIRESSALKQVVGRKPNRVGFLANSKRLFQVKEKKFAWGAVDYFNDAVVFGDFVDIGDAAKPILAEGTDRIGHGKVRVLGRVRARSDSVQRRLHGAGRDFEWLHEEGADGHGDGDGHEEDFNVLAKAGIGMLLQPFICGRFQIFHARLERFDIKLAIACGAKVAQGFVDIIDRVLRKDVALGAQDFVDVFGHLVGVTELA